MKNFTTEEIRDLLNQVYDHEISFSQMVGIMNNRVSETNESQYKDGDFVVNMRGNIIIFKNKVGDSIYDHAYFSKLAGVIFSNVPTHSPIKRYTTVEERQKIFSELAKEGKQWNAEKLRIEDIPQRKFKPGDKVKLKDGILDKNDESLYFAEDMHVFIGKVLTVGSYTSKGYLYLNEGNGWAFAEDWFELYSDEPIVGELAIFWDSFKELSHIRIYTQRLTERYGDHRGGFWTNAIKFESKEQFLEHIKG